MDLIIPEKWYNYLSKIVSNEWNKNNYNSPYFFTNKSLKGFIIITIYLDSLIRTTKEFEKIDDSLKKKLEINTLGNEILS